MHDGPEHNAQRGLLNRDAERVVRPLLLLTSYAHREAPPLRPAPDLKFDLRHVKNPPRELRLGHTGRSKRLREHLLSDSVFIALVDTGKTKIKAKMDERIAEWHARQPASSEAAVRPRDKPQVPKGAPKPSSATTLTYEDEKSSQAVSEDDGSPEEQEDGEDRPTISVGAFCVRGHHRSVAFVEELARKSWPKEWELRVVHRDIDKVPKKDPKRSRDRRKSDSYV